MGEEPSQQPPDWWNSTGPCSAWISASRANASGVAATRGMSSPMCYPQGDFMLSEADVKLGEIGGAPVYIGAAQYEAWKHTQLIIDVVPGRGGMFSLDNGRERRFLTRSRLLGGGAACRLPER